MDSIGPEPPPFEVEDPATVAAVESQWLEIIHAVSVAVPRQDPEIWLGQVVVEVQKASDRAVAAARSYADAVVAEARAEAISIRESGRRRAQVIARLRTAMQARQARQVQNGPDPQAPPNPLPAGGSLPPPPEPVAGPTLPWPPWPPWPRSADASPDAVATERAPVGRGAGGEAGEASPPPAPTTALLWPVVDRQALSPRPPSAAPATMPGAPAPVVAAGSTAPGVVPAPPPLRVAPAVVGGSPPAAPSAGLGSPGAGLGSPSAPLGSPGAGLGSPSAGLGSPSASVTAPPSMAPVTGRSSAPAEEPDAVPGSRVTSPPRLRPQAVLVMIAILVAALGLPVFERYGTAARKHRAQHRLSAELANLEAQPSLSRRAVGGSVFAALDVPRLGIHALDVVEGVTLENLRQGPAHVASSQLPGQAGAVVIVGHRQTYGAPFARLASLRVGDVISLRTPGGLYVYRVSVASAVLHPGSGSVRLPSPAQVGANGGDPSGADQALILATAASDHAQSMSMDVVVATLDQAAAVSIAPSPTGGDVVAQFGFVPGQTVGFALFVAWLVVIAAAVGAGRSLSRLVPARVVFAAQSLAVALCVYQLYLAVDRMIPGTH